MSNITDNKEKAPVSAVKPPVKMGTNRFGANSPFLPIIPIALAGAGILFASHKKYSVVGFASCIIAGFLIGKAITNTIKSGNILNFHM